MLTPADIEGKQFTTTRFKEGYSQTEVDGFLDRVVAGWRIAEATLDTREAEIVKLRRRMRTLEAQLAASPPDYTPTIVAEAPTVVASRLLDVAEATAKQHEAEAVAKADDIVRTAGADAARVVEEAHAAAEKIKTDGYAEKCLKFEALERAHQDVQSQVNTLRASGDRVREALNQAMATYDREVQG